MMSTIKRDCIGLYVVAGGYIARTRFPTRYKEGDKVKTYHFGGSTRAGVGKDKTSLKGHYLEYWTTTGISNYEYLEKRKTLSSADFDKWLNDKHDDVYSIMSYGHKGSFVK